MKKPVSIAIDGPAGAGKSTLAKRLAEHLGYLYIDTGALYRTVGIHAMAAAGGYSDPEAVVGCLESCDIGMRVEEGRQVITLGGRKIGDDIRTPQASMAASAVSAIPRVREFLLSLQRDIAAKNSIIMDGRDIGTVILPDAKIKIFLTAKAEVRARRRYDELLARGVETSYEQVLAELIRRDENDMNRAAAPLKPAPDAITLDTTELDFEQSFAALLDIVNKHIS